mmetsp:Transcript_130454/g.225566  ORF Transcript_130454/g.225566 Transcript_130454/m.225566 type:complete len:313 (+) Transcript_130454:123-1061(+)
MWTTTRRPQHGPTPRPPVLIPLPIPGCAKRAQGSLVWAGSCRLPSGPGPSSPLLLRCADRLDGSGPRWGLPHVNRSTYRLSSSRWGSCRRGTPTPRGSMRTFRCSSSWSTSAASRSHPCGGSRSAGPTLRRIADRTVQDRRRNTKPRSLFSHSPGMGLRMECGRWHTQPSAPRWAVHRPWRPSHGWSWNGHSRSWTSRDACGQSGPKAGHYPPSHRLRGRLSWRGATAERSRIRSVTRKEVRTRSPSARSSSRPALADTQTAAGMPTAWASFAISTAWTGPRSALLGAGRLGQTTSTLSPRGRSASPSKSGR